MSRSHWVVFVLAVAAATIVLASGDPNQASWPVLFLAMFGIALLARALWRMATFGADLLREHSTPPSHDPRQRTGNARKRLTWSYLDG